MKQFLAGILAFAMIGWGAHRQCLATVTYDSGNDFSLASNPNGVWTYGSEPTLAGAFTAYAFSGTFSGVEYWGADANGDPPLDFHNPTASTIQTSQTAFLGPGQTAFHPGPNGEYSIYRFTAPATGVYSLIGAFFAIDQHPTTTDIHILLDNVSIFDGNLDSNNSGTTYATNLSLTGGDTLDFAVGFGNGNYSFDPTGIDAKLTTSVPEPSAIALLALGALGLLFATLRR
jgi:PEP-CTERM motif